MKISKIQVENYRLLKNFSIDLENDLSLVIGKNNCGKTSLLTVIEKFINGNSRSFTFEDFNLDFKETLTGIVSADVPEEYKPIGITMRLFIDYLNTDNLSNISKLMMDLDPSNNSILLSFEYVLTEDKLKKLKNDYYIFEAAETDKPKPRGIDYFLKENFAKYFHLYKKTVDIKDNTKFIDLDQENIKLNNIINYQHIKANRDVSNKEPDKSLSTLSSRIYEKIETDEIHQSKIEDFKDTLCETDDSLGVIYEKIFEDTINKVKKFGGLKPDETQIKITSTLQHQNLLKGNTTVVYKHDVNELPENYNGLGYMNLISMIFEIELLINEFKKKKTEKPADINLLFIEEPEAHTHPQMQYVFIKNIKNLLSDGITREDGENRKLQYIISTHSSHIVSESDFDDIKYLKRMDNSVVAKNLKSLENEYKNNGEIENYKFLKQYLTLHRAELFFADKAIFIEGDTERILLPAMMKKIDQENPLNPMLSQNISIVEVGNYSHIFEKFIDFFGVKSLIITDIDSAMTTEKMQVLKSNEADENIKKKIKQKVKISDDNATVTTNASLKYFYGDTVTLTDLKSKTMDQLKLKKDSVTKKWIHDTNGYLVCVYQTKEINSASVEYHASSFEDSFFHLNRQFVISKILTFNSLKNKDDFEDDNKDPYDLAESCIDKKPAFAIEILLNSDEKFSNWQIPDYIKQGLLWLKD